MTGKEDKDRDIVIYETNEDTVEEKSESGLKESDSEDGPILNKDNSVDFNGSDTDNNSTDEPKDENQNDENLTDAEDKGSWGALY